MHPLSFSYSIDFYPRDPGTTPKNFLFRGNMPVVNGTFVYSSLVDTIKTVSTQSGIKLPTNFKILDIRYFMFVISLCKPSTIKTDNNLIRC